MRAGRAVVLALLVACVAAHPAAATPRFIVGTGQNPGVAVDAAGTAYIGWKVNVYQPVGDAVQLCVLPAGARKCATLATIPFPGEGYNLGRVSVLLPGTPGVVEVTVGRSQGPTDGDGPPRAQHPRPRRHLGAVPGLHADRPRDRLRVDPDLGRRRHHRHLRRDPLRRVEDQVPPQGECRSMEKVDAGTISKGGKSVHVTFRRTVHGPVFGYAKARGTGKQVALSTRRSSYGRETVDQLFFQQTTFGRVHSANDFIRAAYRTPQTFNSFYASTNEAAFVTSGRFPLRPKGVNPDLPVNGEGKYEWTGHLANSGHPQVINPSSGYIVNWNNKPAKDVPASDTRWSEQSLQRDLLLTGELARRPKQTLATVLAAANAAATEDVRVVELWPTLARVLARGKAPRAKTKRLADLLQAWHDAGGSRRDADHDGRIDSPGAAIMDTAWKDLTDAGLCDRLGSSLCDQLEKRVGGRFDRPPGGPYGGWHQYMWKDLRAELGDKVAGKYHLRYCGKGDVKTCAKELWTALDKTRKTLEARLGPDPTTWRVPEAKEDITFAPLPLITMQYTNKPTGIHQVMQFGP